MKKLAGFTLVELLIVIALLAAIALIVIAAINPIEQANRARDTQFNSDSGQLVSAVERRFAAQNQFPWTKVNPVTYPNADSALPFTTASAQVIGVCGVACTTDGVLITDQELKTEFRNRTFIKATATQVNDQVLVGKAAGSGASVYACYVPLSTATRQKACAESRVYIIAPGALTRGTAVAPTTCAGAAYNWTTSNARVCLPQ